MEIREELSTEDCLDMKIFQTVRNLLNQHKHPTKCAILKKKPKDILCTSQNKKEMKKLGPHLRRFYWHSNFFKWKSEHISIAIKNSSNIILKWKIPVILESTWFPFASHSYCNLNVFLTTSAWLAMETHLALLRYIRMRTQMRMQVKAMPTPTAMPVIDFWSRW